MRESAVESEMVAHGDRTGWFSRKMAYIGRRGCADRYFFGFGHILIVETKRPGGTLDPHQVRERKRLAAAGVTVHVVDTIEDGTALLDRFRLMP